MKKEIKDFIIALSIALSLVALVIMGIYLDDRAEPPLIPYEKYKPFSVPVDDGSTVVWEDHFDTVYVSEGITYYSRSK